MTHSDLKDIVRRALGTSIESTIVAAVSGGPDSMAMLHALCELDVRLIVAHFDHHLREDSHLDRVLVERAAADYDVEVRTGAGYVREHAITTRQSIEAAARELRYVFLERVADEVGAPVILTAHTRDDQVETVLMRLQRGAGARGRRGILARRDRVVRPLLGVTRSATRAYCESNQVPFADDPSNFDCTFDRNRVRHEVLPPLRLVFPGIDDALVRISGRAEEEFARAEAIVGPRVRQFLHEETSHSWLLAPDAFTELDRDDCLHLINAVLEAMEARTDVGALHHEMLLDLIAADAGTIAYIPGLRVRREHDGLIFEHPDCELPRGEIARALVAPGTLDLDEWHVEARWVDEPHAEQLSNSGGDVAYIPCDDVMVVRYARDGDRMQPFGMEGHKKLSDVFIDRKVPKRQRATTPVVEVNGEIMWVVGVATSEKSRIHAGAQNVVRLTATRGRA